MTSLGTPLAVAQTGAGRFPGFHRQPLGLCTYQPMRGVVTSVVRLLAGSTLPQYALYPVLIGRIVGVSLRD